MKPPWGPRSSREPNPFRPIFGEPAEVPIPLLWKVAYYATTISLTRRSFCSNVGLISLALKDPGRLPLAMADLVSPKENAMRKKGLLAVPILLSLLTYLAGCVVNKAISASAVADNLAVEKAQNEMLLLNVLRGKDHRPMYVTGISKINGQVKAEASLGATVPFGSVGGDGKGNGGAGIAHYVASPSATYNWNPNFDVIVFDTSEFMHGFLAPVSSDIFAYYWNLGFYPEVLFHLMVLKVQVTVEPGECTADTKQVEEVEEYIFKNNHERGDTEPVELKRFADWVRQFLEKKPHFVEGKIEPLGPKLEEKDAQNALIKGLKEGLTLIPVGKQFQFQRLASAPVELKMDTEAFPEIEYQTTTIAKQPGTESYMHKERCSVAAESQITAGVMRQQSEVFKTKDGRDVKMTIALFLRSPEAILYYLGELARLEQQRQEVPFVCIDGNPEPLFVVVPRDCDCGKSAVEVTNSDRVAYAIPVPEDENVKPGCKELAQENKIVKPNCEETGFRQLSSCDPGRSMEALTIVAQLIALQKSAKDLPTTSVVRVVGQ